MLCQASRHERHHQHRRSLPPFISSPSRATRYLCTGQQLQAATKRSLDRLNPGRTSTSCSVCSRCTRPIPCIFACVCYATLSLPRCTSAPLLCFLRLCPQGLPPSDVSVINDIPVRRTAHVLLFSVELRFYCVCSFTEILLTQLQDVGPQQAAAAIAAGAPKLRLL